MKATSLWKAAGAAALLAVAIGCAASSRQTPLPTSKIEGGAGSLADARKFLQGRWALESFELRPAGAAPITLKGSGVLNYDDFGNLRIEIRADQGSADMLRAAGVDIRDGVISSDGRTAIDLQNHTLTYFIQGQPATGTGPLAMNRPRYWEVKEGVLTLTTKDDSGAPMSISVWKKSS